MRDHLPVGPYQMVPLDDGTQAPWYLMPFDKFGTCEAPATRTYLIGDVQQGRYTDIFLFSHGWNNDWSDANALYDGWLKGYADLQQKLHVTHARPFKPLFIGVIWPSIALVFPSERGPRFAGAVPNVPDALVGQERDEIRALAEAIPDTARQRFYALTQRHGGLTSEETLELAQILAPIYRSKNDELDGDSTGPAPQELRDIWTHALGQLAAPESSAADEHFGFAKSAAAGEVQAASFLLDPRWIVRLATVYQMKDRAGTIGSLGVGNLLDDVLRTDATADVHLIGHSFGAKVLLSALCIGTKPRKVESVLLLQPAVSYLCFSPTAAGPNRPGGYVDAPNRIMQPILSTFSSADFPLSRVFHFACRRAGDLGERRIGGLAPSRYSALGGFGPASGNGVQILDHIKSPPQSYDPGDGSIRVIGINASPNSSGMGINGHGDVGNPATYWMLMTQVEKKTALL